MQSSKSSWLDQQLAKSPPQGGAVTLSTFSQNRSLGYPHTECFAENGRYMVVAASDDRGSSLWRLDLETGEEAKICAFDAPAKMGYYDVAAETGVLVVVSESVLWFYDVKTLALIGTHRPGQSEGGPLPDGIKVDDLPAITPDGREVVVGIVRDGRYGGYHYNVPEKRGRILFEVDWYANHFHFSPHDRNWIAFSHEGKCSEIADRAWVWHEKLAPSGRNVFDQKQTGNSHFLEIGHERWCFHDASGLVVAYGSNPVEQRGVYEIHADGRPPKFIYNGPALHVNISHNGRWAVVDTMSPHDEPNGYWQISDVLAIDMQTGASKYLARSRMAPRHPAHPHPAFSPDDRIIFFNESSSDDKQNRILCVRNPFSSALA